MRKEYSKNGVEYYLKDGVELAGTKAQKTIVEEAAKVYSDTPQRLVVTSGNEGHEGDGVHMDESEHYPDQGCDALDLRIWNLPDPAAAARELQERLGPVYDVVLESTHIHVERDP